MNKLVLNNILINTIFNNYGWMKRKRSQYKIISLMIQNAHLIKFQKAKIIIIITIFNYKNMLRNYSIRL